MNTLSFFTESSAPPLAFIFGGVGPYEMMIVGVIAVLLFGKRLPTVARSMGQSFTEFKKGMHGIENEIRSAGDKPATPGSNYEPPEIDERAEATAPKFEPPVSEPQEEKVVAGE